MTKKERGSQQGRDAMKLSQYCFQADMVDKLNVEIGELGTAKAVAEKYAISEAYLSDVLHGKRDIGVRLANAMGYVMYTVYAPYPASKDGPHGR